MGSPARGVLFLHATLPFVLLLCCLLNPTCPSPPSPSQLHAPAARLPPPCQRLDQALCPEVRELQPPLPVCSCYGTPSTGFFLHLSSACDAAPHMQNPPDAPTFLCPLFPFQRRYDITFVGTVTSAGPREGGGVNGHRYRLLLLIAPLMCLLMCLSCPSCSSPEKDPLPPFFPSPSLFLLRSYPSRRKNAIMAIQRIKAKYPNLNVYTQSTTTTYENFVSILRGACCQHCSPSHNSTFSPVRMSLSCPA